VSKEDERIRRMAERNAWRIIQMTAKNAAQGKTDISNAVQTVRTQLEVIEQMDPLFSP